MCKALKNNERKGTGPTPKNNNDMRRAGPPMRAYGFGLADVPPPNNWRSHNPVQPRPNNDNICKAKPVPDATEGPWGVDPLPFPAPDGLALVILTVSNSNNVQDDSWDFYINGEFVCNYDGGGATSISFYAYRPTGGTHELTASDIQDNMTGNYFQVDVTVDGVNVLSTDAVNGVVGDTVPVGTFDT
ncbi:MAG: hypothetical protein WC661_10210 [Opitutaceae bacterium]|jgi:hypothetical protein